MRRLFVSLQCSAKRSSCRREVQTFQGKSVITCTYTQDLEVVLSQKGYMLETYNTKENMLNYQTVQVNASINGEIVDYPCSRPPAGGLRRCICCQSMALISLWRPSVSHWQTVKASQRTVSTFDNLPATFIAVSSKLWGCSRLSMLPNHDITLPKSNL